jgi:hypothetical protein
MVSQETETGQTIWVNPTAPGRAPANVDQGKNATQRSYTRMVGSGPHFSHLQRCETCSKKTDHHCFLAYVFGDSQ